MSVPAAQGGRAPGCHANRKYPVLLAAGSGRVTFSNQRSYLKAVSAAFVEIKTTKFNKKVRVLPDGGLGHPCGQCLPIEQCSHQQAWVTPVGPSAALGCCVLPGSVPYKVHTCVWPHADPDRPLPGGLLVPDLQLPVWSLLLPGPGESAAHGLGKPWVVIQGWALYPGVQLPEPHNL